MTKVTGQKLLNLNENFENSNLQNVNLVFQTHCFLTFIILLLSFVFNLYNFVNYFKI